MDNEKRTVELLKVLHDYGVPDPSIVGKLPKGGIQLDYVSHAEITKILLTIDPHWRWVPIAWDNGRPAIHVENGIATMWGELTLLGQARLGVGSVRADKADLDKELVGDFLRNAAMRFGIALSLWSKQEWEDNQASSPAPRPVQTPAQPKPAKGPMPSAPPRMKVEDDSQKPLGKQKLIEFSKACAKAGLDHEQVADHAGVNLVEATNADLEKLRAAFNELKQAQQ